jgi:hypothetical protein
MRVHVRHRVSERHVVQLAGPVDAVNGFGRGPHIRSVPGELLVSEVRWIRHMPPPENDHHRPRLRRAPLEVGVSPRPGEEAHPHWSSSGRPSAHLGQPCPARRSSQSSAKSSSPTQDHTALETLPSQRGPATYHRLSLNPAEGSRGGACGRGVIEPRNMPRLAARPSDPSQREGAY